jgi:putative transposase
LGLLKRHLGACPVSGSRGCEYDCLTGKVEVVSFCLMPNHFHLLLYQIELDAVTKLLRAVCSSYVTYFNKKYNRIGTLFQGSFKAVKVIRNDHLLYLTRYIHRNPKNYIKWEWSSLEYWLGKKEANWVMPYRLNDMSPEEYQRFMADETKRNSSPKDISEILFE